ncbi:hypothetical protein D3C87_1837730 [compost metagenome]
MHLQRHKEQRDHGHQHADADTPRHAAADVTGNHHVRRHRSHQQFFDIALEFGAEERRGHVGVRVGDHRHHDQAGNDKLHIIETVHFADT